MTPMSRKPDGELMETLELEGKNSRDLELQIAKSQTEGWTLTEWNSIKATMERPLEPATKAVQSNEERDQA